MIVGKDLDPRVKLIIVMCLSTMGVFIHNILVLFGILLVSFIAAIIFGARILTITKKLKSFIYLFAAIAIMQSIFSPSGTAFLSIKGVRILTMGGLEKGLMMMERMSVVLVSASIMTTTTTRKVIQGLVQWKVPYEFAFMTSIAIRFLPIFMEEMRDSLIAIQLRGIDLKKIPFKKKIQIYSYIFTPIVAGTFIKSQKLSMAMETRAFRAYPERTSYLVLNMQQLDYILIALSILLTIAVMIVSL
ncbi:MAG: energy-coupling factor transporter transmembrane component T [Clostridiaceae bacterium]